MTCANCSSEAQLVYSITPSYDIYYCSKHLPSFLKGKYAVAVKPYVEEAPKSSKKKTTSVVEEAPAEEAPVEDDGAN